MYYEKIGLTKEEYKEYNKGLIELYPWLLPRNRFTDEVPEDYDYSYTELDDMPDGWRFNFWGNICADIQKVLIKADYVDKYRIMQIKEKFGGLRWYDGGAPSSIYDELCQVINKYEQLSMRICINCGKPAEFITTGWISPFCAECNKFSDSIPIKDYFKRWDDDLDDDSEAE